jgi:serine/threonine protein kinase
MPSSVLRARDKRRVAPIEGDSTQLLDAEKQSQAEASTADTDTGYHIAELVSEEAMVSNITGNGDAARRSPFKKSCIRIVEDDQSYLRKSILLDFGDECPTREIPLFGTYAGCVHVSPANGDIHQTSAANCIMLRLPDRSSSWIFALPTNEALLNVADRLCFAGCVMRDLQDHFIPSTAFQSGIRVGTPKGSRFAMDAEVVALKVASSENTSAKTQLLNEVQFLLGLKHEGILRAYGIYEFKCGGDLCAGILLDFMKGQDLTTWIPPGGLPERILRGIMVDVCDVLEYIHCMRIVHRDVKLSNVLCERAGDGSLKVVLADFGLAAHVADMDALSTRCGTPGFVAPEMLQDTWGAGLFRDSGAITKIDMFSFGAMIYAAAVGRNPFAGASKQSTLRRNRRGLLPVNEAFRSLSEELQAFLRKLCAIHPSERCSSSEASLHPWLLPDPSKTDFDPVEGHEKLSWEVFEGAARACGEAAPVFQK